MTSPPSLEVEGKRFSARDWMRFAFWNTKRNRAVAPLIGDLANFQNLDFLILAESGLSGVEVVEAVNAHQKGGRVFRQPVNFSERIQIYTHLGDTFVKPVRDSDGVSLVHVLPPGALPFLVAGLHLPSKLHLAEAEQAMLCRRYLDDIEAAEAAVGHCRTVVVGDFNMNPFEAGLTSAEGFHAVMSRAVASRTMRTVQGKQRRFFFNPMWERFGDGIARPPGTYYRSNGVNITFWNMFDQVLLRPELLPVFSDADLSIVTEIAGVRLVKSGGTPNGKISDHLPVVFALSEQIGVSQ